MSYKYELHCHTGTVSRCGKVEPEKIVEIYKQKGYNGLVITDHYSPMTFGFKYVCCPQKKVDDLYLEGYRRAKAAAGDDFTVLLGIELRHYATANDYLIYGVSEEFLLNAGNLLAKGERAIKKLCEQNGYLVYQAHPFRAGMRRCNLKYLDGIEVYNGKNTVQENEKAYCRAKLNNKLMVSGSDFHRLDHKGFGGIITENPIKTNEDLLDVLRSQNYKIITEN